jgi:subtilisin family serine protease
MFLVHVAIALLGCSVVSAKRYVVVHDHPMRIASPVDYVKGAVQHGTIRHEFDSIGGAAYDLTDNELATLKNTPGLKIYADAPVNATTLTEKNPPSWGLDRVDNINLPLDSQYHYPKIAGKGANVFVIDTGINVAHSEFSKRAVFAKNYVTDGKDYDCNGHGTHVSSTIGGVTVGVAKDTKLYALKVLGCNGSGSFTDVIAAIQYVIDYQKTAVNKRTVINMSIGGGFYQPVNDAVEAAVAAGITVVVAAGNNNGDACSTSPASAPSAITVAASEINDARASYSNFGSCVDIYAPGSNIVGAWIPGTTDYATLSGTSMASPHVAGIAALYLASKVALTPSAVYARMLGDSGVGKVTGNPSGTVNNLLYLKNNFN